ncbi:MAG: hypothetical protein JWP95_262, partial [Actinotalea sp.]|nr:hypothetical protein [Actinotalea sp.]
PLLHGHRAIQADDAGRRAPVAVVHGPAPVLGQPSIPGDGRRATASADREGHFGREMTGAGGRSPSSGRVVGLRWILVHMLEEHARHDGHADLIREAIDGTTGE